MATSERLGEIAEDLRTASSWVSGPRTQKLLALAAELDGADPEAAAQHAAKAMVDPPASLANAPEREAVTVEPSVPAGGPSPIA